MRSWWRCHRAHAPAAWTHGHVAHCTLASVGDVGKWEELRVAEPSREVHRDGGPRGRHREELRDLDVSPGLGDEWAAGAASSQEKDLYQLDCPQPAIDAPEWRPDDR